MQRPTIPATSLLLLLLVPNGNGTAQSVGGLLHDRIQDELDRHVRSSLLDRVEEGLGSTLDGALDTVDEILPEPTLPFLADVDPEGRPIERGVLVVWTSPEHARAIADEGRTVRELRRLEALDRVLVRVELGPGEDPAAVAEALATERPDARVDYNHLYTPVEGAATGSRAEPWRGYPRRVRVRVGIVDGAVDDHEAFRRARIERRDFVEHAATRPADHGTAVASILVADAEPVRGALPGARLHAASVFHETKDGAVAATTTRLVRALDWLVASDVRVINMSLTGPPNAILEAALDRVHEEGIAVVAAVGNNGPVGRPQHPAAYGTVLGVTAVDDTGRIYRYAARGPEVAFASHGVDVAVALAGGGYGRRTGTSMAAPLATAVVAHRIAEGAGSPDRLLADLTAAADDLGDPGFDETYGHGLLAPPR